jgi:hypothetical protein
MTIQVHIKNMLGEAIMIQMSIQSTIPFIWSLRRSKTKTCGGKNVAYGAGYCK